MKMNNHLVGKLEMRIELAAKTDLFAAQMVLAVQPYYDDMNAAVGMVRQNWRRQQNERWRC